MREDWVYVQDDADDKSTERPSLHWLKETDWLRFLAALALLALALACLACVVIAVFMFAIGKTTAALFWILFAVVVKPWR